MVPLELEAVSPGTLLTQATGRVQEVDADLKPVSSSRLKALQAARR
jgi:hypothetical protein